jgi:phage FluMu gp28-like protein
MPNRTKRNSDSPLDTRRSSPAAPLVRLYPYQQRWIEDKSRFKLAVKAAQIGYSFAAALEAVLDCLERRTLWIVLSRSERQSLEFMEKVRQHARAVKALSAHLQASFSEQTAISKHEIVFPNGSRIIGLPANADTARGYTGNMILDEFAFHQHDSEIWAAAFGRVSRGGLKLRVISTPNGQRGKYYELAKACGLTERAGLGTRDSRLRNTEPRPEGSGDGRSNEPPLAGARGSDAALRVRGATIGSEAQWPARSAWSSHWCDVHAAVAEGCPVNIDVLRAAAGDEQTWQQEYECAFLSASDTYVPLTLIEECEHPQASLALPAGWEAGAGRRELYFGYDVARVHDLAVLAIVERIGDVFWTRALMEMRDTTFSAQEKLLGDVIPFCRRGAMDSTGLGSEMAERLASRFPGKVEPVHFTAPRKQEMAVRMKRCFEDRAIRIPNHRELRSDIASLRRVITGAGNIRFDAERSEDGHADRFWALALALQAADRRVHAVACASGWEDENTGLASRDSGFGLARGMSLAEERMSTHERGTQWL